MAHSACPSLDVYESAFNQSLSAMTSAERNRAGVLLRTIPSRSEWDQFVAAAKASWGAWQRKPETYPSCLVVLYGGLAFLEYEDASFWPKFAAAVGCPEKSLPSLYGKLNRVYCEAVRQRGLRLMGDEARNSYVGSAVHHIGIPLSLWEGFLDICEWAFVRDGWKDLPDADWKAAITRLCGSRTRLRTFLLDNREAGAEIISEMLDARRCLAADLSLTIDQLKHACLLRQEYFDEIPETAEFLRPEDPESLFKDRPRLAWNEGRSTIGLHVPGLEPHKLPGTWRIGSEEHKAAGTSDEIRLDGKAFAEALTVSLKNQGTTQTMRLLGAKPWALFDMERQGYIINPFREHLPLRSYVLISPEKVVIKREGFEENDCPENELYEFRDGTKCYLTRLWPRDRSASLAIGSSKTIRFRTRKRIEARLFIGQGYKAAWFQRNGEQISVNELPILCILVPMGYFENPGATLNSSFLVQLDGKQGGGSWETRGQALDDYELFYWRWSERPFVEKVKGGRLTDLKQLRDCFKPADLKGSHTLAVESRTFGIRFAYSLSIQPAKVGIQRCWKNLPGRFLPWFLLAQSPRGLKSEEIEFAAPVVAPGEKFSYFMLKKYEDFGLLVQRGRYWTIQESRASLTEDQASPIVFRYCGDPSILWGLYRKMIHLMPPESLPEITISENSSEIERMRSELRRLEREHQSLFARAMEAPQSRESQRWTDIPMEMRKLKEKIQDATKSGLHRTLPFLEMHWPPAVRGELLHFLRSRNVKLVRDLWNH